ncbi:hypothetical protein EHS25_003708 [Saitozyma podzolica]|uniref:Uncharacterized protein n=1 Tax=Saitozyma podzolica TaxID=1890683 RepID=A0A427Y3C4_9TREE|nr:hypothetical protein EHS25_003708 [Saitozyma podzolica]
MTTTASYQRHSPLPHQPPAHSHRHHPYAPPRNPPRSRRDHSETPSTLGLGVAFGGNGGGKWWDEELPSPPASLASILDSFRRSGEGDRDLLLSILGAKKAEEERLTALIQTRLTILQARLSLHTAAAAQLSSGDMPSPSPSQGGMSLMPPPSRGVAPTSVSADYCGTEPSPSHVLSSLPRSASPTSLPNANANVDTARPTIERTPSLTSRGSASSSSGALSPQMPSEREMLGEKHRGDPRHAHAHALPPPSFWRRDESSSALHLPPIRIERASADRDVPRSLTHTLTHTHTLAQEKDRDLGQRPPHTSTASIAAALQGRHDERGCCPRPERKAGAGGSPKSPVTAQEPTSPVSIGSGGSPRNGLDMLLDAGRRAA